MFIRYHKSTQIVSNISHLSDEVLVLVGPLGSPNEFTKDDFGDHQRYDGTTLVCHVGSQIDLDALVRRGQSHC